MFMCDAHCTPLVFWASRAKNMSLMDSDERKKKIGTPKLKTNFSGLGNIFSGNYFWAFYLIPRLCTVAPMNSFCSMGKPSILFIPCITYLANTQYMARWDKSGKRKKSGRPQWSMVNGWKTTTGRWLIGWYWLVFKLIVIIPNLFTRVWNGK